MYNRYGLRRGYNCLLVQVCPPPFTVKNYYSTVGGFEQTYEGLNVAVSIHRIL